MSKKVTIDEVFNIAGAITTLAGLTVILTAERPEKVALDKRKPKAIPKRLWQWWHKKEYQRIAELPPPFAAIVRELATEFNKSIKTAISHERD